MKYRFIGIIACIAVIAIAVFVSLLAPKPSMRYHQHLEAAEKPECSHGGDVFCTHLPLIEIDTQGLTADGSNDIICNIKIIDNAETNNHIEDAPNITSSAYIHKSSSTLDNSDYALRLVGENGESNPQTVMGMESHYEWELQGPILDKTLIRNYMWYNIAGEIMDYAPNVRFCEAFLNGEYIGLYVMTETVTSGDIMGSRLRLIANNINNSFSGYLLRLGMTGEQGINNIDPFTVYTHRFSGSVNIEYPKTDFLTEEMAESIRQDFSSFEKTIYSLDYNNKRYGYKSLIDVDSFADYFIINEFALNYGDSWQSTYIYKDFDEKFRMCVWDFASSCGNLKPAGFRMQNDVWYVMLFKDEEFVEKVISHYNRLRKTYLSDEYLNGYIDEVINYLGDAVDRSCALEEYDEAVKQLKSVISERGRWMDNNIQTLRQYVD